MHRMISACGLACSECEYYTKACKGCHSVKGSTFWAKNMMPDKTCPLYRCSVLERKYADCGQCAELPCKKFIEMKDPNISEEQHEKSIGERIARLK